MCDRSRLPRAAGFAHNVPSCAFVCLIRYLVIEASPSSSHCAIVLCPSRSRNANAPLAAIAVDCKSVLYWPL